MRQLSARRATHLSLALGLGLTVAAAPVHAGPTTRVSVANDGSQIAGGSQSHPNAGINGAGTVVGFMSGSSGIVDGDTNTDADVFVRDLKAGTTERVSVSSEGVEGDGFSGYPSLSINGRYVAFQSYATNLVSGDTNGTGDVFVHDRVSKVTTRVSVNSAGIQGNLPSGGSAFFAIAGNGKSVIYSSAATNLVAADTNGAEDVFAHDLKRRVTTRVSVGNEGSQGNDLSFYPAASTNGQIVAFLSAASNLDAADDTNLFFDVFVRDLRKGTTVRVSSGIGGALANEQNAAPAISGNGRIVAWPSKATNLVDGDTNGVADIFVRDLKTGVTRRVSVASDGTQANGLSDAVAISGNGRVVLFTSRASNLVPADTNDERDVFAHDLKTGITTRVNVDGAGVQSSGVVFDLGLSRNGRLALFSSDASSLIVGDTNGELDVFLHDLKD